MIHLRISLPPKYNGSRNLTSVCKLVPDYTASRLKNKKLQGNYDYNISLLTSLVV